MSLASQPSAVLVGTVVGDGRFHIGEPFAKGAFGTVHKGVDQHDDNRTVAIKIENNGCRRPQLKAEYKLYKTLNNTSNKDIALPQVRWYGEEKGFNILVMDMLGGSFEEMFRANNARLSMKTVLMLGIQCITLIEGVHNRYYIHRDIKPANFLMGVDNQKHLVYLIDFGLSRRWWEPKSGSHIPLRTGKSLTGTARYVSINTHLGLEQSRRDDLECLGNVLIYLVKGSLPWMGIKSADKKEKYEKISAVKQEYTIKRLCEGLPSEFERFFEHIRCLGFTETPDYELLRNLLKSVMEQQGYAMDYVYDWTKSSRGSGKEKRSKSRGSSSSKRDAHKGADSKGKNSDDVKHRNKRAKVSASKGPSSRTNSDRPAQVPQVQAPAAAAASSSKSKR